MVIRVSRRRQERLCDGRQIHLMIEDKTDKYKVGSLIEFRNDKKVFKQLVIRSVQEVHFVIYSFGFVAYIDDQPIQDEDVFADNEGFDSWRELKMSIIPVMNKMQVTQWRLKLIHWTFLKYTIKKFQQHDDLADSMEAALRMFKNIGSKADKSTI